MKVDKLEYNNIYFLNWNGEINHDQLQVCPAYCEFCVINYYTAELINSLHTSDFDNAVNCLWFVDHYL